VRVGVVERYQQQPANEHHTSEVSGIAPLASVRRL